MDDCITKLAVFSKNYGDRDGGRVGGIPPNSLLLRRGLMWHSINVLDTIADPGRKKYSLTLAYNFDSVSTFSYANGESSSISIFLVFSE